MKVDLNKILARQDYVRMTESLREKCNQVADAISKKMKDLELDGADKSSEDGANLKNKIIRRINLPEKL